MTHAPKTAKLMLRQAGLSIIELLIAITVSLFMLAGLVSVFATSNQTYLDLSRASQQIENGRLAMQMLTDDIAHAGFFGRFSAGLPVGSAPLLPCEASNMVNLRNDAALPVYGYNAPASVPAALTCLDANNFLPGTDILVIRRADSTMAAGNAPTIPAAALTNGNIYLQANADSTATPVIAVGSGSSTTDQTTFALKNKDGTNFAPVRRYHVHIYFISPCSIPAGGGSVCTGAADDNGSPIPTLKRIELTSNGVVSIVPLVEGIENFQVDYGVDADGEGVPDGAYVATPASPTDWSNVVAVRVNLLARNLEPTADYTDAKTYDMGAAGSVTPAGPYKRHVYNSVIRVVNIGSRRES